MKNSLSINLSKQAMADFCKKNHIHKLSAFGSILRDDFNPESDVDMLVEFEPKKVVGFIRLAGMELELTEILGHKVDLRTPAELSHYFRQEVCDLAEVQYVKE